MTSPGRRWLLAGLLLAATAVVKVDASEECTYKPCVSQDQCVYDTITCDADKMLVEGGSVCGCCPGCIVPEEGVCTETEERSLWKPTCDRYGNFSAVQCKGTPSSGRCFCWSPEGDRVDGQRAWESASDMTCACSVRAWQLKEQKLQHEAPRCTTDGSYDELQCSRGVCWCAESRTGVPVGRVVPEGAMAMLYCYKADDVGASYRRRCDSQLEAKALITEVMKAHGTAAHSLPDVACDYDGSFAPVQLREGTRYCAWKNKDPISGYMESTTVENTNMNCNCARDTILLNTEFDCAANGNYRPFGTEGSNTFCVDKDGYFIKYVSGSDKCGF